jgi:predicted GNAT family acetyltransferase
MRLREISPELYARSVLPLTGELWAGRRDLDAYVAYWLEIARSRYGRRHYRTIGLYDGRRLVASFKRYGRAIDVRSRRLRAIGIGAVFTPSELRGRGYASFMLACALDRARSEGYDLVYLFSDIRPQFYAALGFRAQPSRMVSLRADTLPSTRLELAPLEEGDWNGVRRCFELGRAGRPAAFARTPLIWEWIRMRVTRDSEHTVGLPTNLVVRRGRGICAYVLGVRAPERDAYIVDEFGFADAAAAKLTPALLRAAAGDLHRVIGWLPPDGPRNVLPKGIVHKRKRSILMMAALSAGGRTVVDALSRASNADFCWATEHI